MSSRSLHATASEGSLHIAPGEYVTRGGKGRSLGGPFAHGSRTPGNRFAPRGARYTTAVSALGRQSSSQMRSAGRALFPQSNRVTETPNKNPGPQYMTPEAIGRQHESTRRSAGFSSFKNNGDRFPKLYADVPAGLGPDADNFRHRPAAPHYSLAGKLRDQYESEDCSPGPIYENDTIYDRIGSPARVGTRISPCLRWGRSRFADSGELATHDPSSIGAQYDGRSVTKPTFSFSRASRF